MTARNIKEIKKYQGKKPNEEGKHNICRRKRDNKYFPAQDPTSADLALKPLEKVREL